MSPMLSQSPSPNPWLESYTLVPTLTSHIEECLFEMLRSSFFFLVQKKKKKEIMMDYHETKVCTVGKLHTDCSSQRLHRCRLNNNFELNSLDFCFSQMRFVTESWVFTPLLCYV